MAEAKSLEVLEQPVADRVDHSLPGVDLQLRAVGRDDMLGDLHQDAGHHHRDEQHEPVAAVHRQQPGGKRLGHRQSLEHVVDHDLQRPRLQRAQTHLDQEQRNDDADAAAIRMQERQHPLAQRAPPRFAGAPLVAHGSFLSAGVNGRATIRGRGETLGMSIATIWLLVESAT